jgi:hypothetical protein
MMWRGCWMISGYSRLPGRVSQLMTWPIRERKNVADPGVVNIDQLRSDHDHVVHAHTES